MGEAFGRYLGVVYANYRMVCSRYPEWMQQLMNVLVGLFQRYGLAANAAKFRTMA